MEKVVLRAEELDGYLNDADHRHIAAATEYYRRAGLESTVIAAEAGTPTAGEAEKRLAALYDDLGREMQQWLEGEARLHVYSLETPELMHGEASRLIARLRHPGTVRAEFVYYIQRAYEMLFHLAFTVTAGSRRLPIIVPTPVTLPPHNYAVHRIPDIDRLTERSVMCVMLRAALLPSLIVAKEIQEYSPRHRLTPFALFKISRDDRCREVDMRYTLDLRKSFFQIETLHDQDLVFADPMNATGGSLVTIVEYLRRQGVRPRSVKCFNVVSTLKGALRVLRAVPEAEVYTLWMDPALNEKAYILPGLGDAGDRLNGPDDPAAPRNLIRLIADYGTHIAALYRDQIHCIEELVLGR